MQYLEERWDSHVGQKTLLFPSFWIESLHHHCKGGEDEETERKESNGLLGVVKMRRGVEKIAMGVSRFVGHRSGKSIAIDRYQNVYEWYTGLTDLPCELECRMEIINIANKALQFRTRT